MFYYILSIINYFMGTNTHTY